MCCIKHKCVRHVSLVRFVRKCLFEMCFIFSGLCRVCVCVCVCVFFVSHIYTDMVSSAERAVGDTDAADRTGPAEAQIWRRAKETACVSWVLVMSQWSRHALCQSFSSVFLHFFLVSNIPYLDFPSPHDTWYACSSTWPLTRNRRFVSRGARFPWC